MSLLAHLRSETRDLHTHLEARMGLPDALTTPSEYRLLLERLYGFYRPLEELVALPLWQTEWEAVGIDDIAERSSKSACLEADLHALSLSSADIARLPHCLPEELPTLDTFPRVLGCAYVLEGATLGGQIIARHIEEHLGEAIPSGALSFYRCYGTAVGKQWQLFRHALDAYPIPETDSTIVGEAATAACQTFRGLEQWLFERSPFGKAI